jgi:hypothetical protein
MDERELGAKFTQSDLFKREWAKVVAKAWADPDFRKRVEEDPRSILRERNIEIPDGVELSITSVAGDLSESIRPLDMAVAAGVVCYPVTVQLCFSGAAQPGGGQPSTSGWQATIGTPLTAQLCFSGAAQPGGGQPSTSGWQATIGTPLTAQLCFSGAAQPGGGQPSTSGQATMLTAQLCFSGEAQPGGGAAAMGAAATVSPCLQYCIPPCIIASGQR